MAGSRDKREKNTMCRDSVPWAQRKEAEDWLGRLPYRWSFESNSVRGGGRLRIHEDPGGVIVGIVGDASLSVEGPTFYSCIGIVRTRLEKKKAELLAKPQQAGVN